VSIELEFHLEDCQPLDVRALLPAELRCMKLDQLKQLKLSHGREQVPLNDVCKIHVHDDQQGKLTFAGDTHLLTRAGYKMESGELIVSGNAGDLAGAEMSGGMMQICGNAGELAGAYMSGGILRISGSAGDQVGAQLIGRKYGLNGGEIYISGDAGSKTGSHMRRGLIVVGRGTQHLTGYRMWAGTIMVFGIIGKQAGLGMQRGTIVANSSMPLLPGFHRSCQVDFIWLKIYFRHLKDCGMPPPHGWNSDAFFRYVGQFSELGKGEILLHELP